MELLKRKKLTKPKSIAVFDMDNTILRASFIGTAAKEFGFENELNVAVIKAGNAVMRTKLIGQLLKGKSIHELLDLVDGIQVTSGLTELLYQLKARGYITGIISDSYECITEHIKEKFAFDFTISNALLFSNNRATGFVEVNTSFLADKESICQHEYCKTNALRAICENCKIDIKNSLVIGDGENDICCLQNAGIGVSFCSANSMVDNAADFIIKEPSFNLLAPVFQFQRFE
ncbi:MAG: HAD-IB family phosphatase [Chitinophagaceae bacterium]|nr:HAD-IB family phosphatase [Chitinophagaceae bacterium]